MKYEWEKDIEFRDVLDDLDGSKKRVIIESIRRYMDNEELPKFHQLIDKETESKYNVHVSYKQCKHCKMIDISVSMGVCGNYVAWISVGDE